MGREAVEELMKTIQKSHFLANFRLKISGFRGSGSQEYLKIDFPRKIFNLQMLFDPERFALGGGISKRQSFIDAVNDKIDELLENAPEFLPRPQVVACKYHNDANLFGALYRYLKK